MWGSLIGILQQTPRFKKAVYWYTKAAEQV